MNKRRIVLLVGVVVFGLLGWMGYSSAQSLKEKEKKEVLSDSLTEILESLKIDAKVPEGKTMLIYFNSECQHCQWEIQELGENIAQFSSANIALVSLEPSDSAIQFLKKHSLQQYFVKTNPEHIMSTFSGGVPQIFIYQGDKLQKKFRGEVKVEALLEALK